MTPPQRGNQRSDAIDPAYGGLPKDGIATASDGGRPSFADPAVSHDITRIAAAAEAPGTPSRGAKGPSPLRKLDTEAMTASLDALGFTIEGVKPTASDLLDGPVPSDESAAAAATDAAPAIAPGPSAGAPAALAYAAPATPGAPVVGPAVSATEQAAGGRRLARHALDVAPGGKPVDLFDDPDPGPAVAAATPPKTPPLHPKIFDASEGTALDPLRDKTYDLNSGKTIPTEFQH